MNNKGFTFFLTLMIGIVILILALAFTPVLKEFSDNARNSTSTNSIGLDCSNSSINDYNKASCLYVDYLPPFFAGFLIFIAGAIIVAKVIYA